MKIKDHKKYLLFSELHSLLLSGVSFSKAFELLIEEQESKQETLIIQNIYSSIVEGKTLWESMKDSEHFAVLDFGVIHIGEETGKLVQSLFFLSDYYKKKIAQKRMLINSLSYPLIILMTAVLVLFFMITFVVPMFEQVYGRMGGQLPKLTIYIINLSKILPQITITVGVLVLIIVLTSILYKDNDSFREIKSIIILRIPFLKKIVKKNYQARFCKLLYLLLSSNVPLIISLDTLKTVITFYPYQKSFESMCNDINKGKSFSKSISKFEHIYDCKLRSLIKIGEETNKLNVILQKQGDDITFDLEHQIKQIGNLLEPILVIFVGGIVAIILIAMYLPMFKLGQHMG